MKRAFVIHLRSQDLESVGRKVGEIVPVLEGRFYPFDIGALCGIIQEVLSQFDTSKDFIVPMGSTLVNFLAGYYLGQQNTGLIKIMVHDVKTNMYREVIFAPDDLKPKEE